MCGPDYSQVNDKDVHAIEGDRFSELTDAVKFGAAHPQPVTVEDFSALKFTDGLAKMQDAADDIAENHTGKWNEMAGNIQSAASAFRSALNGTIGDGGWTGTTGQAAWNNLNSSLETPNRIAAAASRMSVIVDGFSRGIHDTKKSFVDNMDKYNQDLEAYPDQRSTIEHDYDSFARTVMSTIYTPVIDTVAANHPDTGSINPPSLGGTPGVPTSPGFTPGGAGSGGATPPGAPAMPAMALPGGMTPPGLGAPGKGMGDPTKAVTDAAKGAGDAAKGLGGMAGKGGGQLANAAQQAMGSMGQALKGGAKPPGLPEGMLNLGPKGAKGLSAAGKGGGAGGGRSGGAGAGAPKPTTQSTSATPTKAAAAAPVSKAGVSPQGSAGGAGAPAAGNRGTAVGGVHKANKALRNQRNGQDVIGEADAAVAVVGDEPKPPAAPKPGTS